MSDQQEDPQVTIKNLQDQIGSLEEQARLAAEAHAADMNRIVAMEQELADIKSRWEEEVRAAVEKALKKSKGVVKAVEGESVLLAKDVRAAVLAVRNEVDSFAVHVHLDTILQKLGIK